jgi:hypothetical protein
VGSAKEIWFLKVIRGLVHLVEVLELAFKGTYKVTVQEPVAVSFVLTKR